MGFCLEQGHVIDATFYKREQILFPLVFLIKNTNVIPSGFVSCPCYVIPERCNRESVVSHERTPIL